jgi:hypothetical protein
MNWQNIKTIQIFHPVQEKLARAYYEMLKTGGGDLEEIRGFISELQDTEQAAVEQAAQQTHLPMRILKFVSPLHCPQPPLTMQQWL